MQFPNTVDWIKLPSEGVMVSLVLTDGGDVVQQEDGLLYIFRLNVERAKALTTNDVPFLMTFVPHEAAPEPPDLW